MNANEGKLVWTDEDLDDERAIDPGERPPWWGKAPAREMTWAEADALDIIPDIE